MRTLKIPIQISSIELQIVKVNALLCTENTSKRTTSVINSLLQSGESRDVVVQTRQQSLGGLTSNVSCSHE